MGENRLLALLAAPDNIAFVIALAVMVLVGLVELVGLGTSMIGHDLDIDVDHGPLAWLGFGRLPLLMMLVVFLAAFGLIGLLGQQFAVDHLGHMLGLPLATGGAALAALPVTAIASRLLARVIPRDETSAIGLDDLVGQRARILTGTAAAGSAAKARVVDDHGQAHNVMVEPAHADETFPEGAELLLVRRTGNLFHGIATGQTPFSNWIEP